ncbi:MAG TPA: sodium:proton antiporter [Cytophagales bacterium]|nr:sodium:proton antiporter [Cytophagales bacterium]HAP62612.1 sodium:proton antiporter [Cytophagales bacterium]
MTQSSVRKPHLWEALLPMLFLILALSANVYIFGDNSLSGSNQIILLLAAAVAALVAGRMGITWSTMLRGIVKSISSAMGSILILLLIGSLAGTWLISGIVPAMIYYGLDILNPTIFLFAACVVSAIVSLATGSSWTTIATVGVALLGIGQALGISEGLIGGAIISGAYFGDKMSPLSDTTNLAPAMAGTDLFTHIRYMSITTVPSIIITLIIFLILGFLGQGEGSVERTEQIQSLIGQKFNITGWLFLVPVVVIVLIIRKVAAIPALLVGTLLGGIFAIIFQPNLMRDLGVEMRAADAYVVAGGFTVPTEGSAKDDGTYYSAGEVAAMQTEARSDFGLNSFITTMVAMYGDISVSTGDDDVDGLLSTGGMYGMLNTIWLILCAMVLGGVLESAGMLHRITDAVIKRAKSTTGLIGSTAGTCVFFNVTASDQYLSIVVPGRMYADTYKDRGLAPENLSRTLEDSGTVTSVLVPWNTCGATQASVLGVATLVYAPYCFFNIISPIMTVAIAAIRFRIRKLNTTESVEDSVTA